ncbi:MAG: hypothetical protein OXF11_02680, partial [Deltaproteobacteria bacterium]|nr:hypothetical protein [Deltaproteobacteria bacterium]
AGRRVERPVQLAGEQEFLGRGLELPDARHAPVHLPQFAASRTGHALNRTGILWHAARLWPSTPALTAAADGRRQSETRYRSSQILGLVEHGQFHLLDVLQAEAMVPQTLSRDPQGFSRRLWDPPITDLNRLGDTHGFLDRWQQIRLC